jgi:hypothetical protein
VAIEKPQQKNVHHVDKVAYNEVEKNSIRWTFFSFWLITREMNGRVGCWKRFSTWQAFLSGKAKLFFVLIH